MARKDRRTLLTEMRLEQEQANRVRTVMIAAQKDVERKLGRVSSVHPLTRLQLKAQRAMIMAVISKGFDNIEQTIKEGRRDAAIEASKIVSETEAVLLKTVLGETDLARLLKSEALRTVANLDAAMKRISGSSYVPLSEQIYRTKKLASGWIDQTIDKALVQGWSASDLAKAVAPSLNPNVRGGVSYAANRLARTEINNAYHAASADRYLNSNIVEKVDWNLSSSHPENDECDEYKRNSPYDKKNIPAKPHPNCYCFITPTLPTQDEFLNNLFDGKYDEEDWRDKVKFS